MLQQTACFTCLGVGDMHGQRAYVWGVSQFQLMAELIVFMMAECPEGFEPTLDFRLNKHSCQTKMAAVATCV